MTEENQNKEEKTEQKSNADEQKAVVKHVVAPPPPPPPPSSRATSPFSQAKNRTDSKHSENTQGSGKWDNNFAADLKLPPSILTKKNMGILVGGIFCFGMILGSILFSGGNTCPPCSKYDMGVIRNPEMPKGTKRCGVAELWEPCSLWLTNSTRGEQKVRELYPLATSLSSVPVYRIDPVNLRYANEIIKPGYIAEIVIPPAAK